MKRNFHIIISFIDSIPTVEGGVVYDPDVIKMEKQLI